MTAWGCGHFKKEDWRVIGAEMQLGEEVGSWGISAPEGAAELMLGIHAVKTKKASTDVLQMSVGLLQWFDMSFDIVNPCAISMTLGCCKHACIWRCIAAIPETCSTVAMQPGCRGHVFPTRASCTQVAQSGIQLCKGLLQRLLLCRITDSSLGAAGIYAPN